MIIYLVDFDHKTQCCMCGSKGIKRFITEDHPYDDYYQLMFKYFKVPKHVNSFGFCNQCFRSVFVFSDQGMNMITKTTEWKRL